MSRVGNLIIGNYDISSSHMSYTDVARSIANLIDTKGAPVTFQITAKAGGRMYVHGFLYTNKQYGAFVFILTAGQIVNVSLENGVYKQIGA